ncbi:MAG: mannose-1-phosphate guanylyltransferase, partial [Phycisphaerae bacterium]
MRHAVIMAGGSGTRLWPLSRRMRPKQLMRLFDGASLLQIARRRLAGVFARECTWVITNDAYIDLVASELPDLPRENLIGEPTGRDTANAIGLAAALIVRRDPDATIAVFTADHIVEPIDTFADAIRTGLDAAEAHPDALVTFGVTPDSPHTGYGYLQKGAPSGTAVYRVREFREKPTRAVAERYLSSGEYLWNSGMFAWRASAIRAELERLLLENFRTLDELAEVWGNTAHAATRTERFASLQKISIDYGVMEKARRGLVVEMRCRWSDLGSWSSIAATQGR